jgi:hypothetical protein
MKKKFLLRLLPKMLRSYRPAALSEIFLKKLSRNEIYEIMDDFYFQHLPLQFVKHRKYFSKNSRGFGEDAFHSMWYLLFSEFKPVNCLEIGVYRGQTLTLWGLLARHFKYSCNIECVSPFSSAGDSVSKYNNEIDYLDDTLKNHKYFNLGDPKYCVEFSNSDKAKSFISQKKWDLIYIDGSHDYDIVCDDFETSLKNLAPKGIIVMDDSSLYFDYAPGKKSFAGHPGPSRVAKEIVQNKMHLLGGVGHNNIFQKK